MLKRLRPYMWLAVLALPSLYLLVASSNQYKSYSPLVVSPTHWYIAMLITGMLCLVFVDGLRELAYGAGLVLFINVAGYAAAYYRSLWIIGGPELASLGLNILVQPVLTYTIIGTMFLTVGLVIGILIRRLVDRG
jgi:hypothetical protein